MSASDRNDPPPARPRRVRPACAGQRGQRLKLSINRRLGKLAEAEAIVATACLRKQRFEALAFGVDRALAACPARTATLSTAC